MAFQTAAHKYLRRRSPSCPLASPIFILSALTRRSVMPFPSTMSSLSKGYQRMRTLSAAVSKLLINQLTSLFSVRRFWQVASRKISLRFLLGITGGSDCSHSFPPQTISTELVVFKVYSAKMVAMHWNTAALAS